MTREDFKELAAAISNSFALCHKEVLTADEAVEYTGISKSTLYKLTMRRVIPHSKPNGKVLFFNRRELEQWMMSNPVATAVDINSEAMAYCMKNEPVKHIKRK